MTLFVDIESGGFKNREMVVMMGRRSGKSTFYQQFAAENVSIKFKKVDEGIVDGIRWFTIGTTKPDVASWLRTQPKDLWTEQSNQWALYSYFDVHEKLYMMIELKFR